MIATLTLILLLAAFLVALSHSAGGPRDPGLPARLVHGVREFNRLARHRDPLDRPGS